MIDEEFFSQSSQGSRLSGIGSVVRAVVANSTLSAPLNATRAVSLWPEVAGEQLSKVCIAESIHDGTLYIKAKSSSWANELTFHKPDLLKKLNAKLGAGVVNDIHFATSSRSRGSKKDVQGPKGSLQSAQRQQKPKLELGPMASETATDPRMKLRSLIARSEKIVEWRKENGWIECARCRALYDPTESGVNINGICQLCAVMSG